MKELIALTEQIAEYYRTNPVEWFSIIAMDDDVILRMPPDEFAKHPELIEKCNAERKEQGISYSKEIKDIIIQAFKHIPKEDKFKDIWDNIESLDAEWYLPDSIKWMMFDYWTTLAESIIRTNRNSFSYEQMTKLKEIKEAIHYVE